MVTASRNASRRFPSAADVEGRIEQKFRAIVQLQSRMDDDYDRFTLKRWEPKLDEPLGEEDIYTTNAPRVLAEKIIAFISATEPRIGADNTAAQEEQENRNDLTEELCIGMLNNADRHHKRAGDPTIQDQLASFSVLRGRWAAARAVLRKRPNGDTFEDILPLDPRDLVIQRGDGELKWAAYRMRWTAGEVRDTFPRFEFEERTDSDETVDVFEYYTREVNPDFDIASPDPFMRHPFVYMAGTIVDSKWARPLHNLSMLSFPVVLAPVTAQPEITASDLSDTLDVNFGESIMADNREIWDLQNRSASLIMNLMGKAADPRMLVSSLDGTKTLDEGATDTGAQINTSTANQEDVKNFDEADINNAATVLLNVLERDSVAGGLPPQAFGLLDKPLSSVALRQLGNNLEHKVLPRMRAVAACIEGCLENLLAQYETGSFMPISASGRRYDNHAFANRRITPEQIFGHDPISVKMDLALPEDETSRWALAQIALTPHPQTGETLASMEWVRERILKMQSHKSIHRQNLEGAARFGDPVAQAMSFVTAALNDGDFALASIWFDKLQVIYKQSQVQAAFLDQQLSLASQGLPIQPAEGLLGTDADFRRFAQSNTQSNNPANGAPGIAERRGIGNEASPDAGANTTGSRNRSGEDTGLIDSGGNPILFP